MERRTERDILIEEAKALRERVEQLECEVKRVKTLWVGLAGRTIYMEDGDGCLRRWYPRDAELRAREAE